MVVFVRDYIKRDGTYVSSHTRGMPFSKSYASVSCREPRRDRGMLYVCAGWCLLGLILGQGHGWATVLGLIIVVFSICLASDFLDSDEKVLETYAGDISVPLWKIDREYLKSIDCYYYQKYNTRKELEEKRRQKIYDTLTEMAQGKQKHENMPEEYDLKTCSKWLKLSEFEKLKIVKEGDDFRRRSRGYLDEHERTTL